jgi:hypothetical protein
MQLVEFMQFIIGTGSILQILPPNNSREVIHVDESAVFADLVNRS